MTEERYCGIYIRVSTDDQETSVNHQVEILKEFSKQKELGTVIDSIIYKDVGVSGYTGSIFDRPHMQRLVADAEQGLFKTVIFKGISRFARDTQDALDMLNRLKGMGLRVLSYEENFDSAKEEGNFLFTLHAALAEQESDKTAVRVRLGMRQKAKNGGWTGCPPYGYKVVDGKLHTDEKEAEIVKSIFEMYSSGFYGIYRIAKHLNLNNIKSRSGNLWNVSSIHNILRNQVYLGRVTYSKKKVVRYRDYEDGNRGTRKWKKVDNDPNDWIVVDNCHEALVDVETFDKSAKLLKKKGDIVKKIMNKPRYVKHLLSGLLKCQKCGNSYIVHSRKYKGNLIKRTYICIVKNQRGKIFCDSPPINAVDLEEFVIDCLRIKLQEIVSRTPLEDRLNSVDTPTGELQLRINEIDRKLQKLNEDNADLFFKRNDMTKEQYELIQQKIKENTDKLITTRSFLEKKIGIIKEDHLLIDEIWEKANDFIALQETDVAKLRPYLESFIDRIEVDNTSQVHIHYLFDF